MRTNEKRVFYSRNIIARFLSKEDLSKFDKNYRDSRHSKGARFEPTDLDRRLYAKFIGDEIDRKSLVERLGFKSAYRFYSWVAKMFIWAKENKVH